MFKELTDDELAMLRFRLTRAVDYCEMVYSMRSTLCHTHIAQELEEIRSDLRDEWLSRA